MTYRLQPERRCAYAGCEALTRARLGFCPQHYSIAHACVFDAACQHRCAAHSKTRLCQEHSWYTRKMQLMQQAEE